MEYKWNDKIIQTQTKFKGKLFEKGNQRKKRKEKTKTFESLKFTSGDSITMKYRCNDNEILVKHKKAWNNLR